MSHLFWHDMKQEEATESVFALSNANNALQPGQPISCLPQTEAGQQFDAFPVETLF